MFNVESFCFIKVYLENFHVIRSPSVLNDTTLIIWKTVVVLPDIEIHVCYIFVQLCALTIPDTAALYLSNTWMYVNRVFL